MQKRAILLAVFSVFLIQPLSAEEGQLDPAFGNQGIVLTDFKDEYPASWQGISEATSLAIASDGKIVVGGSAKYFFISPPSENLPTEPGNEQATILQSFGMGGDFALVRYLPNGSLDKSFSLNGKRVTDFKPLVPSVNLSIDTVQKVLIQPDGKIIALGNLLGLIGTKVDSRLGMSRYLSHGGLDPQFNANSALPGALAFKADMHFDADSSHILVLYDAAIDSKGRILVALGGFGKIQDSFNMTSMLIRFLPNGSLDPTFNPNGVQPGVVNEVIQVFSSDPSSELASISLPQSLLLEGDELYVLGSYLPSSNSSVQTNLYLEKILENGSRDLNFGKEGLLYLPDNEGKNEIAHQVYRLKDSHFLIAALRGQETSLMDLDADGSLLSLSLQGLTGLNPPSAAANSMLVLQKRFATAYNECSDRLLFAYTIEDKASEPAMSDVGVARWKRDATHDESYNSNSAHPGLQILDFQGGSLERAREIALQVDGKLLVSATSNAGDGKEKFALARLQGSDTCQPPQPQPEIELPPARDEAEPESPQTALTGSPLEETLQGGGGCACSFGSAAQSSKIGVFALMGIYLVTNIYFRKSKRGIAR